MRKLFSFLASAATILFLIAGSAGSVFDRETLFGSDDAAQGITQNAPFPVQATDAPYLSGLGNISLNEAMAQFGSEDGSGLFSPNAEAVQSDSIPLHEISGSEKISAAGYDAGSKTLAIQMRNSGEVKTYLDVPEILYQNFLKSTIKDSFYTLAIDGRYTQGSSLPSGQNTAGEKITISVIP